MIEKWKCIYYNIEWDGVMMIIIEKRYELILEEFLYKDFLIL